MAKTSVFALLETTFCVKSESYKKLEISTLCEHLGEMSPNFMANWHRTLGRNVSECHGKMTPNNWAKCLRISWQITNHI